jgi:holo-[acyl-carrier protein] synthase
MIVATGIDIVEVYRIEESMTRTPRFADRVFTAAEREYCDGKGKAAMPSYAGRFAAKEAFLKALGSGWRGEIAWQDIEIVNDEAGAPSFNLTGEAARLIDERQAKHVHLSISHTKEHAVASVIIER